MSDKVKDDVYWVDKGEAARELEVSLSALDRMIRKGEMDVQREGRRVYVKLPGPRYPSDREPLHHSRVLNIRGESYRLREKRHAGLFSSHHLLGTAAENGNDNYPD